MITAYHRPQTLEEALALLARPEALPLGGGTIRLFDCGSDDRSGSH
jgi:CO/xanthine dehydrogenase FAD-binding subunit